MFAAVLKFSKGSLVTSFSGFALSADAKGTAALVLCLSLGALYQQAPKRKPKGGSAPIAASPENAPLISAGGGGGGHNGHKV